MSKDWRIILNYGLIFALVFFVINLIIIVIDIELMVATWYQWTSSIFVIIGMVMTGLAARKGEKSFSYGRALKVTFFMSMIAFLVSFGANYVYTGVISPETGSTIKDLTLEKQFEQVEKYTGEEPTDEQIDKMRESVYNPSVGMYAMIIVGIAVFYLILSSIISIFLRVKGEENDVEDHLVIE